MFYDVFVVVKIFLGQEAESRGMTWLYSMKAIMLFNGSLLVVFRTISHSHNLNQSWQRLKRTACQFIALLFRIVSELRKSTRSWEKELTLNTNTKS